MKQFVESVSVTDKVNDKIAQIETRRRRKFTEQEKQIAAEMFLSGFLFSQQWSGNEFIPTR